MNDVDTEKIANLICQVAATEIMPRFNNLRQADIREKKPGDLVTAADEAAEEALTRLLQEYLPGSLVVGEEAVSKDPAMLGRLKKREPVWIIDPVDGTSNFAKGNPQFGVYVALVQGGVTRYAWAYDPPGDRMALAAQGAGARLNGRRITVTIPPGDMKQLVGQCDGAPAAHFDSVRPLFRELVKSGCCLHDYMNFLTGRADFVAHVDWTTPWDHAAPDLIAREAGAWVALDNGRPYDPSQCRRAFMMAAPGKMWWDRLQPIFYPLHVA
ncbi:MAG: inositol monophosphatase [Alphaproteobacteria bacterium]|nr:MAG: inositol monophosphatase [Alphaproteobacteria bacterium]